MPSFAGWPVVVLVVVLALVLGSKWAPDLLRVARSATPSARRRQASVFGDAGSPARGRRRREDEQDEQDEVTVRLPVPDLPVTPGRPPYATSVFAAITDDTPRPLDPPQPRSAPDGPGTGRSTGALFRPETEADTVRNLSATGDPFSAFSSGAGSSHRHPADGI